MDRIWIWIGLIQIRTSLPSSTAAHVKDDPKKSPISITYWRCDMTENA